MAGGEENRDAAVWRKGGWGFHDRHGGAGVWGHMCVECQESPAEAEGSATTAALVRPMEESDSLEDRFLAYAHMDEREGEHVLSEESLAECILGLKKGAAQRLPAVTRELMHLVFQHVDVDSSGTINYADFTLLVTLMVTPPDLWQQGFDLLDDSEGRRLLSAHHLSDLLHAVMVDDPDETLTQSMERRHRERAPSSLVWQGWLAVERRLLPGWRANPNPTRRESLIDPDLLVSRITNPNPADVAALLRIEADLSKGCAVRAGPFPINHSDAEAPAGVWKRLDQAVRKIFKKGDVAGSSPSPHSVATAVSESQAPALSLEGRPSAPPGFVSRPMLLGHVRFLRRMLRAAVFSLLDASGCGRAPLPNYAAFLHHRSPVDGEGGGTGWDTPCRHAVVLDGRSITWQQFLFISDVLLHIEEVLQACTFVQRFHSVSSHDHTYHESSSAAGGGGSAPISREVFTEAVCACLQGLSPSINWQKGVNDLYDAIACHEGGRGSSGEAGMTAECIQRVAHRYRSLFVSAVQPYTKRRAAAPLQSFFQCLMQDS